MVQLTTHQIKVSVISNFEGVNFQNNKLQYAFLYHIEIENLGDEKVQLIDRYWKIKDALNYTEIVRGKGVIGQQPILLPHTPYKYTSGCLLNAPIGSMQGYYGMITGVGKINIPIPLFKLSAPFSIN